MGYAPLFESGAVCENAGISRDEVDWLNAASVRLRDVHRAAVARVARVHYADPGPRFAGSSLCSPEAAFNGLVIKKTPGEPPWKPVSAQSLHPNEKGVRLLAEVFTEELRRLGS